MASSPVASPTAALPAVSGAGAPRPAPSVRPWRHRHHQPVARRLVAAARRRYKGTANKEAALADLVERKVAEAMEACGGPQQQQQQEDEEGCRVAWDEVEEVSQARADLRRRLAEAPADPLEPFCARNPAADDCAVVYVDD